MTIPARELLAMDPNTDSIVDVYIAYFCPRTDLYVANGAGVVREPITRDVIRKAVKHKYPISAYLGYLAPDGSWRTYQCAVDFDREDGLEQAITLGKWLETQGILPVICKSRRGAHIWVMLDGPLDGYPPLVGEARRFLRNSLTLACGKEVADDEKTEVFPKEGTDLAVGALRLPGMIHHKTQEFYPMLTPEGEVIEGMKELLLYLEPAPAEKVRAIAGPPEGSRKSRDVYKFRAPARGETMTASEALQRMGVENARPGITVKCPVHEDRRRSLTIFKDDKRVYCGAPACALHGDGHGVGSIALAKMVKA